MLLQCSTWISIIADIACILLNIHNCAVALHMYVKRKKVGIESGQWLYFTNDEPEVFNAKFQGSVICGKLHQSIKNRHCFWIPSTYLLNLHPDMSIPIQWSIHMDQTDRSRTKHRAVKWEFKLDEFFLFR